MFHIYIHLKILSIKFIIYTQIIEKKVKFETKNSNLFGFFHEFASLPCCSTKHSKLGMKMKFNPQNMVFVKFIFYYFRLEKLFFSKLVFLLKEYIFQNISTN